jgi:hypothetical protein
VRAGSVGVPVPLGITNDSGRKRPDQRRPVGAPRVDGQALHEGVLQRPHGVVRHRLTLGTHAGDDSGGLPVLTAYACPYPELAEQDRGICEQSAVVFY